MQAARESAKSRDLPAPVSDRPGADKTRQGTLAYSAGAARQMTIVKLDCRETVRSEIMGKGVAATNGHVAVHVKPSGPRRSRVY